jgi:hypothetical protein
LFSGTGWLAGNNTKACWMRRNLLLVCSCPLLIFSSGCSARPECDSIETRQAVLQFVLDDRNNPLVDFATKNSSASGSSRNPTSDVAKSKSVESAKPLYQIGQKIVTASTSKDKLTLKCSGELSVAVGDLMATKEVIFQVQQSSDGTLSVSVEPFQF